MDVEPSRLLSYFDLSDDLFPWHRARVQEIERRRATLGDVLLFDILLNLGGIRDTDILYPPHDVIGLERLLDAISTSKYDSLKKDCLIYFLLKWHRDGRERRFGKDRSIPPQFTQLAEAYWCLDAAINVPTAIALLSDARLNQDYSSKILQAISTAPDIEPYPLILKYVRTAKPLLTEPEDLDLYLVALAHRNLFEAWQFQRSFSEDDPMRSRLFKKMLEWCVSPKPKATPLTHLLTIPLTPYEKSILDSYASFSSASQNDVDFVSDTPTPSSLGLATLQNLACTRLIQTGQYADAIKLHRQFSSVPVPISDSDADAMDSSSSSSSSAATKMVQERNDMIEALYSTLPSVERALLDAEIKGKPMFGFGIPSTTTQAAANAGPSGDTTMSDSQSWDEIHRHEVPGSGVAVNGVNAAEVTGRSMPAASTSTSVTAVKDPIPPSVPTTAAAFGVSTNFTVPSSFSLSGSQSSAPLASAERESLASSRAGAPRFGGAPPILPISSGAGGGGSGGALNLSSGSGFGGIPSLNPNLNLSSGLGGGRKSLPFNSSAFNMLNTSTALSSSTSGAGAAANANQQQQQNPLSFSSSKRKPNAFYKPPPAVNDDAMPNPFSVAPVQSGVSARSPERQPRRNKGAGVDVGMSEDEVAGAMQVDDEDGTQGRDPNARGEGGLGYSLFANHSETLSSADRGRPSTGRGRKSLGFSATSATRGGVAKAAADRGNLNDSLSLSTGSSSSKKRPRPPGAFIVDGEEDEDEDEDDVDMDTVQELPSRSQLPPLQIPTRQTRSSRKSTAPAATSISAASGRSTALSAGSGAGPSVSASTASRVTSTSRGRVKKARTTTTKSSKKTVPGAMFEDDEGDREESDAQSQSQSEGGWSPQQTRSRRGGASNRGKGQARARKEKELSVDEGDEGEEEEQDRVAPLGAAATRSGRTTTRATRKTRGSTAASLDSNEDGGVETGTRRRSSRISTVGSAGADGGSRKSTRKSVVGGASTTTGRRKTRT